MRYFQAVGSPVHSLELGKRRDESQAMYSQILGQRIDIVLASELHLEARPSLQGFVSEGLHTLIAESLPARFVEPRPAVCIADGDLQTLAPGTAAALFDGITIHEVAHLVAMKLTPDVCQGFHGRDLRAAVARPLKIEAVTWLGHDANFIRAMLHLVHRAASRGHSVSLPLAFCHKSYGLSSAQQYAIALGDECSAGSWLPLSEALARPMPDAFKSLWMADVLQSLGLFPVSKGSKNVKRSRKTLSEKS